jgi:hypothetical protein
VKRTLERLGFIVRRAITSPSELTLLQVGRIYSWDELGLAFGFNAQLFQVGGGMLSRPDLNACS